MTSASPFFVTLAAAAFMTICGSLNGVSSSTFSREGRQFWISRVIPVSPREQVSAKFLHSYLISVLGVVTASLVSVVILHLKAGILAKAIVLALTLAIPLTALGMIIDLARPLLDWTNPQKAIKQNLNVLLAMAADVGVLTGLFFGLRSLVRGGLGADWILALLFGGLAAFALATWRLLVWFAGKRYREIEA